MQVKVSITHTVVFEVREGLSIEGIRTEALARIEEGYSNNDQIEDDTVEENVSGVLWRSVNGNAIHEEVTTQVTEVK